MKKFGVLGLATVMLGDMDTNPLFKREEGQSDDDFRTKINHIMDQTNKQISENLAQGVMVGIDAERRRDFKLFSAISPVDSSHLYCT